VAEDDLAINVRDLTAGYRFQEVLGKLGRWRTPWVWTMPQYVVLVVSFVILVSGWRRWGHLGTHLLTGLGLPAWVPAVLNVLIVAGLPLTLCLLAGRNVSIDGRPPFSAAMALLSHLASVAAGRVTGPSDSRHARLTVPWAWLRETGRIDT
jgi:hypothetical protein